MKPKVLFFFLLTAFPSIAFGQTSVPDSLASLFHQQLMTFPQEKIYLHTDKPYYISGENIWFRAYIADAVTHIPFPVSQIVTVELINPLDSVLSRVKILKADDIYHGNLLIPEDAPEGDYTLRAYTAFMRSQDENYFYSKTVRICDPQTREIQTNTEFTFESAKKINATFRFLKTESSEPFVPKSVKISLNGGQSMEINKIGKDGTASVSFDLAAASRKRIILLEMTADQTLYRQFIQIPVTDNDFDVSFFPEGGSLMQGTSGNVAFKAMYSNGKSANITGVIYDQSGTKIEEFKSDHLGMGKFLFLAEKGKTYYANCTNEKGQSKRFDLPSALEYGYALSVTQNGGRIIVSVQKPEETVQNGELYLLAHIRGMIYLAMPWDHGKSVVIRKEQSPSGVMHLILFDAKMNPVSERLVFINNNEEAIVASKPGSDRYAPRSLVKKELTLTDNKGKPLSGNFSVSVTSDKEVKPDSTSNILTQLLLTSDLYGYIENPTYYFKNTPESTWALDLLMLTQGWRRYDIAGLAKSRFTQPTFTIEDDPIISGTVKNIITGKPVKDIDVAVRSYDGNFFESAQTDSNGRFYFNGNVPDSTGFLVSALPRKGMTSMNLVLNEQVFPVRTLLTVPSAVIDTRQLAEYADKAELKYTYEHGKRTYLLPEITITARQAPRRKSQLVIYAPPPKSNTITAQDIEDYPTTDMYMLLSRIPGITVVGEKVTIHGGVPLIVVDDFPLGLTSLNFIKPDDIEQIDVIKNAGALPIYGSKLLFMTEEEMADEALSMGTEKEEVPFKHSMDGSSAIMIYTKKGQDFNKAYAPPANIKTIMPLGYQSPVEFYAPKYDTPEKKNSQIPDLRTTIHWQPVVQINNEGVASFEFYTDDEAATFTTVIEGIANNGTIIRYEE